MDNYEKWLLDSPMKYQKKLVASFIQKTIHYSEKHIQQRTRELNETLSDMTDTPGSEEIIDKKKRIEMWKSYIEFQNHTLTELKSDKLNDFFDDSAPDR